MKKLIPIALIILLIIIKKPTTKEVFNEIEDEYTYSYFYIKKDNLNSTDLNELLKDELIQLIGIYPKIEKSWDTNLKEKIEYYSCSPIISKKENINRFINNYIQQLKNNNYIEEANKIFYEGIKIEKILIYAPNVSVINLKNNNKNIIYKQSEI